MFIIFIIFWKNFFEAEKLTGARYFDGIDSQFPVLDDKNFE